jgi:pilus assembly protein CpaC
MISPLLSNNRHAIATGWPGGWTAATIIGLPRWGVLLAALAWLLSSSASPAAAQGGAMPTSGATMTLAINKSQTLRVARPIGKAAVGNDKIADIVPISGTSIYVLGKTAGTTNLALYDRQGALISVIDIMVVPDSEGLKRKLAELMPTENIGVSVANDALVLEGTVSSPVASERILSLAQTFAGARIINLTSVGSPQQVLLEVRFAEMSRSTVKALGINNVSYDAGLNAVGIPEGVGVTAPPLATTTLYRGRFSFGNLQFQLDALEQQGLIHTLAQPNLIAMSGENAYFLAGGEFPIPASQAATGNSVTVTVEFKPFGVSLTFTPTVLEDGLINLLVSPEVSSLDPAAGIDVGGLRIPGLKVRRARTTVELRDGQAFAIAGLIQSDFADTVAQVPLLGRVPILGPLFRSTSFNRNETELVMIVTPRLVRPTSPAALAMPTDVVQQPSDLDLFLKGQSEKRGRLPGALSTLPGGIDAGAGPIVR